MSSWQIKKLGDIAEVRTGPFGAQLHEKDYVKNGTPIITVENLMGDVVRLRSNTPQVSAEDASRLRRYVLNEGDIVFSRVGSVDRSGYVEAKSAGWLFSGRLLRVRHGAQLAPRFLNYSLHQDKIKNLIRNLAVGGTMPSLNTEILNFVPVSYPSKPEQERIVRVLMVWDECIEKLERKITLKEELKKGLMQQLLTGKKHLPGFTYEWKQVKLGGISKIKTGGKDNQDKITDGDYPFFVRSPYIERIDSYSFDGEAILVPGEGNIGKIFHYINGKFDYHQRVYGISNFQNDVSGRYIYYYFVKNFARQANKHSVKATVDSLRLPTFSNFLIDLPEYPEQIEIVNMLDLASSEIHSLKQKQNRLKEQKIYLLKNLITGTIRTPETLTLKGAN